MTARFSPSVTVAAVAHDGGDPPRWLLVEEHTPEGLKLNNPAGHLEAEESPLEAVSREALEETGRVFTPQWLLGVYMTRFRRERTGEDVTYLRFAYAGRVGEPIPGWALDEGIVRTVWMTLEEIRACPERHRSPLVLACIEAHAAGVRHPLGVVIADASLRRPAIK